MARHRERGAFDRRPSAHRYLLDPPSGMARGLLYSIVLPTEACVNLSPKKTGALTTYSDPPTPMSSASNRSIIAQPKICRSTTFKRMICLSVLPMIAARSLPRQQLPCLSIGSLQSREEAIGFHDLTGWFHSP